MSVREAFQMAAELGATTLVPIHWDLFAPNSVFREELLLLYDLLRPPFRMMLNPANL
jgi:L-ascorbate metabolism protein UlaG (beta-lactamase superfamily)